MWPGQRPFPIPFIECRRARSTSALRHLAVPRASFSERRDRNRSNPFLTGGHHAKCKISQQNCIDFGNCRWCTGRRTRTESGAQTTPAVPVGRSGTFGGPASYFANGFDGILNNQGTAVGWASTTEPDPTCNEPNCIATHAFNVKNGGDAIDLGALPGGLVSQAYWISANGLIVGASQNGQLDPIVGFPQNRGVLWRNGEIIDLGVLPEGGYDSLASAVNSRGQVAGFALNTVPDPFSIVGYPGQTRAFLWQDGVMQDLGTLGGPDAIAGLINDRGDVAGISYPPIDPAIGTPVVHPFLWRNGKMIDVGSLGGTDSEPTGLNQNGEIVGFSSLSGDAMTHPFLWKNGQLKDLGTLGGNNGTTNWINDRGEIAGKADLPGPAPQDHDAVLWREGRKIDLGTFPGDSCSNAYFVNMRGQVVGTSEKRDLCHMGVGEHAFLWQHGHMIDLNTVIPPGANLQLTYAVAINERGEIAGYGVPTGCDPKDYELCGHAYVLLPCVDGDECVNVSAGARNSSSAPSSTPQGSPATSTTNPAVPPQWLKNIFRNGDHFPGRWSPHSD